MAAPWVSTKKLVRVTTSLHSVARPAVSAGFVVPTLPTALAFRPRPLYAAIAKMQALRMPPTVIVTALRIAATSITGAIVDNRGPDFDLVPDAETIELTARTALAGSIGAGICHLYMTKLRYKWHDHANKIVSTSDPLADFVYDGGPAAGHGIVLAEAKGSFSQKVDAPWIQSTAKRAYTRQVDPHIGLTALGSRRVIHGYAVKFGAQLASRRVPPPPNAFIHVTQTSYAPAAVPGAGPGSLSAGGGGAPPGSGNQPGLTILILGNYRAAFLLAGASVVVNSIDAVRGDGTFFEIDQVQRFDRMSTSAGDFVVGLPPDGASLKHRALEGLGLSFAIREDIAIAFLSALSDILNQGGYLPDTIELPAVASEGDEFDDDFVFPDGFSMIEHEASNGEIHWSPQFGLIN